MYYNAIFDLDGTLLNSFKAIKTCVTYAFNKHNREAPEDKILRKFMGPSLYTSFTEVLGLPVDAVQPLIDSFREEYSRGGMLQGELYNGVLETLLKLKDKGVKISLATSKPDIFVSKVLTHHGIFGCFDYIVGAETNANHSDKEELIKKAKLSSPAIMIGDRKYDIIGAKKAKVDCIGVTYGYADEGEFNKYKPDYLANNLDEVYKIIIG